MKPSSVPNAPDKGLLTLAWRAAAGFHGRIIGIVALGFAAALLEAGTLILLFDFVGRLTALAIPGAQPPALGRLSAMLDLTPLTSGLLVAAVASVRFSLTLLLEWLVSRLWVDLRAHMQGRMLALHLHAQYARLLSRKAGEHVYNIMEGPSFAASFYLHFCRYLAMGMLLVVLFATLLAISPVLMGIAAVVAALYLFLVRRVAESVSYASGQQQSEAIRVLTNLATEGIAGVRFLKALGAQDLWMRDFAATSAVATRAMQRSSFWNTVPARSLEFIVLLIFVGLALAALTRGGDLATAVPSITVYFLGLLRVLPTLSILGSGRMQMMTVAPNLREYLALLDLPQEADASVKTAGARPTIAAGSRLRFEGVGFAYGDKTVLRDFAAEFPLDRVTALVGPSGQGKSTILDLVMRLYAPTAGTLTLDGRDCRDFDLRAWRDGFAYVGQEPFLFHASVADNLRIANPDASLADIEAALAAAGAATFAAALPQGLDTVLADRGLSLSGGQRQRIAIARALVSKASVLLLDEPTSGLDADTERQLMETLLAARAGRGIILATHREDLLAAADRIHVLDNGRVAESGTRAELRAGGVHYRRVFNLSGVA